MSDKWYEFQINDTRATSGVEWRQRLERLDRYFIS